MKTYFYVILNGKFCQRNGNFNEFCNFFDTFKPDFRRLADKHPIIYIHAYNENNRGINTTENYFVV